MYFQNLFKKVFDVYLLLSNRIFTFVNNVEQ